MSVTQTMKREDILELIELIDSFHGNELKDRSESSINDEIDEIEWWLNNTMKVVVEVVSEDA